MRVDPSSSSSGGLSLGIEVDGGDRQAQAMVEREGTGVEMVSRSRSSSHDLPPSLLEQHEHVPVDPYRRPRCLIAHHLSPCVHCINKAVYSSLKLYLKKYRMKKGKKIVNWRKN